MKGKKLWSNPSDAREIILASFIQVHPCEGPDQLTKSVNNNLSVGNKHVQRSASVMIFKFLCHLSTSNHQINLC